MYLATGQAHHQKFRTAISTPLLFVRCPGQAEVWYDTVPGPDNPVPMSMCSSWVHQKHGSRLVGSRLDAPVGHSNPFILLRTTTSKLRAENDLGSLSTYLDRRRLPLLVIHCKRLDTRPRVHDQVWVHAISMQDTSHGVVPLSWAPVRTRVLAADPK